ncbi:MAG: nucleotide exchange factor GrpE [Deltaproteobacteria bacterium]|nr:nucleotide exchange factor GrpE [Deltaproteobacteria bacterium]
MTDEPLDAPTEPIAPQTESPAASPESLLEAKDAEIADLKSQLLYQRAELDNFRKRTEKRYREALEYASEPLLKDLLPVLDDLERAIAHARETGSDGHPALLEGLDHVALKLHDALGRHGVEAVAPDGERFDPNVHESLCQLPGEEDNRVAQVFQKGYLLKGRLLRPARVAVSKVATRDGDG